MAVASGQSVEEGAGARSAWRVATSRNFGPYFVGSAASASGTWFHNLAASVLVFELTHSALLLGLLSVCQYLPVLALSPWAGRMADERDRRHILLVTQPLAAATSGILALLAATGHVSVAAIFVCSFFLGSITAFSNTAQMALVGSLVPRADLPQAVALNSITFNLARAFGPLSAAVVIAAFGSATAFTVNALSFVVFVGGVLLVHTAPQARPRRSSLRESIALVRARPRLLASLAVIVTVSFVTDPINTEGPALAHAFGLSPTWAGAIVGAFGAGAVTAGILIGGREGTPRRLAATLALMGCGVVGLGIMPLFALALVLTALAGVGYLGSNAGATSQLQLGVGEEHRGRIMALWSIAFLGIRPVASFLDGAIADTAGVRVATVVMALPAFALAAVLLELSRREARHAAPALRTEP